MSTIMQVHLDIIHLDLSGIGRTRPSSEILQYNEPS